MLKHGVDHDLRVTAVDINPAAIATVKDTIARLDLTAHLSARFSDLVPSDLETAPYDQCYCMARLKTNTHLQ